MGYILLTEYETVGYVSCKVKGLASSHLNELEIALTERHVSSGKQEEFFEADTSGITILNLLTDDYKIVGQSMVIEKSNIGGRTVQVQKIVWTLQK